ncbi:MAG TPA: hypothetical protein VGF67_15430 [Ktedonobacteraceae bacterium]
MQQPHTVRSNEIQAGAGGRELRDEELVGVSGGTSTMLRNTGPTSNNGLNPAPGTPGPFSNSLLGSLLGYSSNSFLNTLMEGEANSGNMSPFSFLGF